MPEKTSGDRIQKPNKLFFKLKPTSTQITSTQITSAQITIFEYVLKFVPFPHHIVKQPMHYLVYVVEPRLNVH